MGKKVTVHDIAEALGVSICTVNKALSGKPKVSEERRRQIQEKAREMGFEVDSVAQAMGRNPITVGVVSSVAPDDLYYNLLKQGMEEEFARLEKYKIYPVYYEASRQVGSHSTEQVIEWIKENNVEAVCFCPNIHNTKLLDNIIQYGIPVFLSGGGIVPPKEIITTVSVDAYLSGQIVADFFHCVYGDNIHAAVLLDSMNTIIQRKKTEAFCGALSSYGITDVEIVEHFNDLANIHQKMEELLAKETSINCVYVTTGYTLQVCQYLEEQGLKDKIALVGTDYYPAIKPYIMNDTMKATLLQNQDEIGRLIVRSAYDYLVKSRTFGNENWRAPERIYVKPTFCFKSNFIENND